MGVKIERWKIAVIAALPIQILLVVWASYHPEWVERYYAHGLYPYISWVLRASSGLVPVPIGQLIFYALIVLILVRLFSLARQRWRKKITGLQLSGILVTDTLYFFSITYFLFMISWGMNYQRQPVSTVAGLDVDDIQTPELYSLCGALIEKCNTQRDLLRLAEGELPLTDKELLQKSIDGFSQAPEDFGFLRYNLPSVKSVLVPELMSAFGVAGIYFLFTGEANVNMGPPNFLVPATTCHEMAHQLGYASEDEANYIAYLTTQFNPDLSFQYSGNLMAMRYTMRAMYRTDTIQYQELIEGVSKDVLSDLAQTRAYWRSFDNPIEPISDVIYDLFLKANSQKAGIASYSQVVRLLVAEHRKGRLGLTPPEAPSNTSE
ncbi:MAG: DUF3810 domain-containing protein [Bacteroidota bacterium]